MKNPSKPLLEIAKELVVAEPSLRCDLSDALMLLLDIRPSDPTSVAFMAAYDDEFIEACDLIGRRKGMGYLKLILKPSHAQNESHTVTALRIQNEALQREVVARRANKDKIKNAMKALDLALGNEEEELGTILPSVSGDDGTDELD